MTPTDERQFVALSLVVQVKKSVLLAQQALTTLSRQTLPLREFIIVGFKKKRTYHDAFIYTTSLGTDIPCLLHDETRYFKKNKHRGILRENEEHCECGNL